ncbi:MAG: signal peptide peptidase SppA [Flavobacteriales bacterium]|nr:signal peptide peptidase SppA [Flavobacteriales bacterium]|tara:strand:- start:41856 stop:43577 length:1722 start_codon:yes stop_codon:yes gene_type:complete
MKSFLKNTLSRFLSIILLFIFFLIIVSILIPNEKEVVVKNNTILNIKFDKAILDRTSSNPLPKLEGLDFSTSANMELKDVLDNIEKAKNDGRISGIYLTLSEVQLGFSQAEEIRKKLIEFKGSGKFIYSYSEGYSQLGYYLSSVADKMFLNPEGMVEFNGLSAGILFYKGFFDKIGIDVQVIRHGKFKSAVEPYMSNEMSRENREQLEKLLNSISDKIIEGVSEQRNISTSKINEVINKLQLSSAVSCKDLNFVDELKYEDEVISILEEKSENNIKFSEYLEVNTKKENISENKIAIIYATGGINTGEGSYNTIGSETTVKAIRKAAEDDKVKAIVFRINSPGGSALASDIILREINLAKQKKKVVVSMGNYAASGGYYIACTADKIFANSTTLTGSIGVFGLLPNSKLLNDKLGIYIDTVNTHKYSDVGRGNRRLTNYEVDVIQKSVEDIYDVFISHVSGGRGLTKEEVDEIGQGRVWSGIDAKEIGLVDEIGGLEDAIVTAAKLSEIEDYRVITLPKKTDELEDLLKGFSLEHKIIFSEFLNLSEETIRQLEFLKSADKIQARLPFLLDIR